jgi:hypothetical protein
MAARFAGKAAAHCGDLSRSRTVNPPQTVFKFGEMAADISLDRFVSPPA